MTSASFTGNCLAKRFVRAWGYVLLGRTGYRPLITLKRNERYERVCAVRIGPALSKMERGRVWLPILAPFV